MTLGNIVWTIIPVLPDDQPRQPDADSGRREGLQPEADDAIDAVKGRFQNVLQPQLSPSP